MGSQIAVLGTDEDLGEILTIAIKRGARAVPEFIAADEPPHLYDPGELWRTQPGEKLYLLPEGLAAVEIFTIAGSSRPGLERVNERTSPVVEIVPGQAQGQEMKAGRIYLGVSASDSLYRHAKRLYDGLKRSTESWQRAEPGNVRVGPQAAEKAKGGGLVLKSAIGEQLTLAEAREK